MKNEPNINALWGALLVEEMVRQGVRQLVLAPGSRSTPIVVAAARNARLECHLCTDERAAAFFALGLARGNGDPAAIVTTSGTAAANLLPAVIEASVDDVPLIAITADRPFELRDCGAPQTIEQPALFSGYTRWHLDLPAPDDRIPARVVLTATAQAVARARSERGPVHLNCAFREPLAPEPAAWDRSCLEGTEEWCAGTDPFVRWAAEPRVPDATELDAHADRLRAAGSGVILAAARCTTDAAATLAEQLGWPLWADVRSGLRIARPGSPQLAHLDRVLAAGLAEPEVAVLLGGRPNSKHLLRFLDGYRGSVVQVDRSSRRLDPNHRPGTRVIADVDAWCAEMAQRLPTDGSGSAFADLAPADERVRHAIEESLRAEELSEPFVAHWLSRNLTANSGLFVSSSMPIRDVQHFGATDGPPATVAANRGANGIDGVVASAAGFAAGLRRPVTLLIGDLALQHDLGSLALLAKAKQTVAVVVLNNGGGSIFSMLPIAQHEDVFTPYFDTPHSFSFAGVASDFGLAYHAIESRNDLSREYRLAMARGGATLLEVRSGLTENRAWHDRLEAAIRESLQG